MCSPCASSQASASCAGVQPASSRERGVAVEQRQVARRSSRAGSAACRGGCPWRRSADTSRSVPVRKPRASGLKATKAAPSSRQASSTAISGLRVHSEYSVCTRGDRVHRVRAAQRRGRHLRQADRAHLALAHQIAPSRRRCPRSAPSCPSGAGSRGRSRRCCRRCRLSSQLRAERLGPAVDHALARRRRLHAGHAALAGQRDPLAVRLQHPADQRLVGAEAVQRRGVEQRDARVERREQQRARPARPAAARRRRGSGSCSPGRWRRPANGPMLASLHARPQRVRAAARAGAAPR